MGSVWGESALKYLSDSTDFRHITYNAHKRKFVGNQQFSTRGAMILVKLEIDFQVLAK